MSLIVSVLCIKVSCDEWACPGLFLSQQMLILMSAQTEGAGDKNPRVVHTTNSTRTCHDNNLLSLSMMITHA